MLFPAPPHPSSRAAAPAISAELRLERNRHWLQAHARSSDPTARLACRNALVAQNLDLVRSIAARETRGTDIPFDDLVQVGCLGLIRALEGFDPERGTRLSTFAVPYIRGAMRQEHRNRQSLMRIPRPLWDLRQQATRLQEERRRQGADPLGSTALARALGCGVAPLTEALQLGWLSRMPSLDAPRSPGDQEAGEAVTLLEQVADPASLPPPVMAADDDRPEERLWLQRALQALPARERQLVLGRIEQNRTWVELGHELGIPARQAQRRCQALLTQLRQEAERWRQSRGATASASSAASRV